jgi:hypothetical protein
MKTKILSVVTLLLLVMNSAVFVPAKSRPKKTKAGQTSRLVSLLPDSDAVAVIDARRFFDEALPRVLASKRAILSKITVELNDLQRQLGIDVRKFDQLAVGVRVKTLAAKQFDVDPVLIAKGSLNMGTLIAASKLGTKGEYREEKVGDRTVYIFSIKDAAKRKVPPTSTSAPDPIDNAIDKLSKELAVGTLDTNTLVIGSLDRVRETFEAKSTVAPELTALVSQRPQSVFAFATRTPEGVAGLLPIDNDELGSNLESIRYFSGWVDVTPASANLHCMARTVTAERAQSLFDTVEFLKDFGKGLLGNSKKPENAVLARMVENTKLSRSGTDVLVDLTIPQSDIDLLLAKLR